MRMALFLAAILAFAFNVSAKDKDADPGAPDTSTTPNRQFTHEEEFRVRYVFEDNQSASKSLNPTSGNVVEQRLRLAGQYKVSERFAVAATLMNNLTWGSQDLYIYNSNGTPGAFSSGDVEGVHSGGGLNNLLSVQEAYGSWTVSDDILLRFGRASFTMGDGSVISVNDYEALPVSFDGIIGTYDFQFARISGWIVKLSQYSTTTSQTIASGIATSGNQTTDPEADSYGLSFDLQKMPEWLKLANLHVIETIKSSTPGSNTLAYPSYLLSADPLASMGQNVVRYGFAVNGTASFVDYKLDGEGMSGKYFCQGAYSQGCIAMTGTTADTTVNNLNASGYMAQAELGATYNEFYKTRVFVRFHWDTGDSSNGSSVTKIGTYDPYFYDKYSGGGEMEVLNWGNLTYYNAGISLQISDQWSGKFQYFYFQKTETAGPVNPGPYGSMMDFTSPYSRDLGQEFDVSSEYKFDGGFALLARAGAFIPGASVNDGLTSDPNALALETAGLIQGQNRSSMFTQVMVQGKMVF